MTTTTTAMMERGNYCVPLRTGTCGFGVHSTWLLGDFRGLEIAN